MGSGREGFSRCGGAWTQCGSSDPILLQEFEERKSRLADERLIAVHALARKGVVRQLVRPARLAPGWIDHLVALLEPGALRRHDQVVEARDADAIDRLEESLRLERRLWFHHDGMFFLAALPPAMRDASPRDTAPSARRGVSERVARSRELVARGYALAAVARVVQVTRQAIYRVHKPRPGTQAPVTRRRGGRGDRRDGEAKPHRRLPAGVGAHRPQARPRGQSQARPAGHARRELTQRRRAVLCRRGGVTSASSVPPSCGTWT